jgi:hypothetical protein
MTMNLAELQDSFQKALLAGDDRFLEVLADGPQEPKDVLLGLYRDAYILRLIEFVQNDHALLHSYVGDAYFDQLARAYAAANPSHTRNARYFCERLPTFLASAAPYDGHPQLAELAALEKALNDAFDAADAPALSVSDLAALPPDDWPDLVLAAHPSAIRLDQHTNAADIWMALNNDNKPPQPEPLAEPSRILVWRQDAAKFRVLGVEEAMMWDEAARGASFGVLCEMAATFDDPDGAAARAAGYLQGWIASGLLLGHEMPVETTS